MMKESLYDVFSDEFGHVDFRRSGGMSKSKQVQHCWHSYIIDLSSLVGQLIDMETMSMPKTDVQTSALLGQSLHEKCHELVSQTAEELDRP